MNFCSTFAPNTASNENSFGISLSLAFGFRNEINPRSGNASVALFPALHSIVNN
jgi:hypothetical protein